MSSEESSPTARDEVTSGVTDVSEVPGTGAPASEVTDSVAADVTPEPVLPEVADDTVALSPGATTVEQGHEMSAPPTNATPVASTLGWSAIGDATTQADVPTPSDAVVPGTAPAAPWSVPAQPDIAPLQPEQTLVFPDMAPPSGDPVTPTNTTAALPLAPVWEASSAPDVPVDKPKKSHVGLVLGVVIGVVVLAVAGAAGGGWYYFNNHVKPGVALMGQSMAGKSQAQVEAATADLLSNYHATLTLGGKTVNASARDLGVTFDQASTVQAVMAAPAGANVWHRYNPWADKAVTPVMSVDTATLGAYLDATFITADQRAVAAGVSYDAGTPTFALVPGINGLKSDPAATADALKAGDGLTSPVTVATVTEQPSITDATAQTVVDQANQRLTTPLTITAGSKSYTIPATTVGNWLTLTPDTTAGTITLGYDTAKIAADVPPLLDANLATAPVQQVVMTGPAGQTLGVETSGKNGTTITGADAVVQQVEDALTAGTALTAAATLATAPYTTVNSPMDSKYLAPDGAHWVEVNLSNFTVTGWAGTTQVLHSAVVVGGPATPTRVGIFHVYSKVASQTMKGANADGSNYELPGVPWIAYFSGGIALHGAYWRSSFGYAASHGCVNEPVGFAKLMYDFVDIGTMVIVHR